MPKTSKPQKKPQIQPKTQLGKTKNDLKRRAKIIVKSLQDGKSETQACKDAGYSKTYAENQKQQIMGNPLIAKTIREIYDAGGITDEFLQQKHLQLITAKEVKVFNDKDNGIIYSAPLDDNTTQLNALKLAHQVKGNLIERSVYEVRGLEEILNDLDG